MKKTTRTWYEGRAFGVKAKYERQSLQSSFVINFIKHLAQLFTSFPAELHSLLHSDLQCRVTHRLLGGLNAMRAQEAGCVGCYLSLSPFDDELLS